MMHMVHCLLCCLFSTTLLMTLWRSAKCTVQMMAEIRFQSSSLVREFQRTATMSDQRFQPWQWSSVTKRLKNTSRRWTLRLEKPFRSTTASSSCMTVTISHEPTTGTTLARLALIQLRSTGEETLFPKRLASLVLVIG